MTTDPPQGIAGWLVVLAALLSLFAIRTAFYLVTLSPALHMVPGETLWTFALVYEFIGNILLVASALFLLVFLFRKRRIFPRATITFFAVLVIFTIGDLLLAASIPELAARPTFPWRKAAFVVVTSAIAVWYLLASHRVKATFTH